MCCGRTTGARRFDEAVSRRAGGGHHGRASYMFSTRNAFSHYIRLNYSYPWTAQSEAALQHLGTLVHDIDIHAREHT